MLVEYLVAKNIIQIVIVGIWFQISHFGFLQNYQCCIMGSNFSSLSYHVPYGRGAAGKFCTLPFPKLW